MERQNERRKFCETLEILSQVSRTYFKGGKILPYIIPDILMVMPFSLHHDYLAVKRKQKQSVGLRCLHTPLWKLEIYVHKNENFLKCDFHIRLYYTPLWKLYQICECAQILYSIMEIGNICA